MEKGITQTAKHTLMLDGRSRAKLTGVTAVSCFNDRRLCWKRERAKLRCWEKTCTSSS